MTSMERKEALSTKNMTGQSDDTGHNNCDPQGVTIHLRPLLLLSPVYGELNSRFPY
jgi:hypothetical protein